MGSHSTCRTWTAGAAAILIGAGSAGCGREQAAPPVDTKSPSRSATGTGSAASVPAPSTADSPLQQPFAKATHQDAPADWQRPPDLTLTGKSVGKLYTEVVKLWDTIRFSSEDGKRIVYTATLDTEWGPIEIALRPDLAPNHVRNFVALARAGYYDGLVFERAIRAKPDDQPEMELEVLEAGCPLGTGDEGIGSIGYWLKPEFTKEPHEVGTVGACHGAEPDSAACKFYITLTKAPLLDGNFTVFAKVAEGLDVARRIFSQPVRNDPEYPEGDRPEKPVVIRKVTIHTKPEN